MQAQDHYKLSNVLSLPALEPWTARFHSATRLIALFSALIPFACATGQSTDPVASEPFSQEKVDDLVLRSSASGNFERGLSVYTQAKAACFSCHRIGSAGGIIGPDLSLTSKQRTPSQLAESLLWPNRLVAPEYQSVKIETSDGALVTGYISFQDSTEKTLVLKDPATQVLTQIDRAEIERQANGLSLMPMGLVDSLNDQNQADLLAFLVGLGTRADIDLPAIEATVRSANTHEPATFPLVREPIHPEQHPARTERVNRDRIYDFYTKQATFFSGQVNRPKLLAQFPGVDGATFGHWGNQDEAYWQGEEMNASVQGLVLCNVLVTNPKPIARAVCFRVGLQRATWTDGRGANLGDRTGTFQRDAIDSGADATVRERSDSISWLLRQSRSNIVFLLGKRNRVHRCAIHRKGNAQTNCCTEDNTSAAKSPRGWPPSMAANDRYSDNAWHGRWVCDRHDRFTAQQSLEDTIVLWRSRIS